MGKPLDLTGQRFGKLVALRRLEEKKGRVFYWECQCDCGNVCKVVGTYLKNGNTKSCGCGKYDGLKKYNEKQSEKGIIKNGSKFGKLTVLKDLGLKPYGNSGKNRRYYLCKCDCGNVKEILGNSLKQNHTLSCGECLSSVGEYKIINLLKENNIIYNHDVLFEPLFKETGKKLRFDFIIYDEKGEIDRFIEFDGRQHFFGPDPGYWSRTSDTLEDIKNRDLIKNNFCLKHNYKLIRIPYTKKEITLEDIYSDKYLVKGGIFCD